MSDLIKAIAEVRKASPGYITAEKFYDGTASEVFASDAIKKELAKSAGKFRINVSASVVEAVTDRAEVTSVIVPDNDDATQRLLDEVWRPNELTIEVPGWIEKVCEYGDAYILVWDPEDEDDTAVDVFIHSPHGVRAFYSTINPRRIDYVAQVWQRADGHVRVNLWYSDRIEEWVSLKAVSDTHEFKDDGEFEQFNDDAEGEESDRNDKGHKVNPYDRIPWFHGRTKRPYGVPVHHKSYGPQNVITKLVATQMSTVDWYGWPYRYALSKAGTTGANLVAGLGDWERQAPSRDAKADPPQPGELHKLHDTDTVGQLEATPAANFLDPIMMYFRVLAAITGTPMDGINPSGAPESGESRHQKLERLLSKVEAIQQSLESTLSAALSFALEVAGVGDKLPVQVSWKPTEKISDKDGWDAVIAQIQAGVPTEVALSEAGYLVEQVKAWKSDPEFRLIVLTKILAMTKELGAAVQLGGITEEQASELVTSFLGEVLEDDGADAG